MGGAVRQRRGRFIRFAKRDHEPDRKYPHLELVAAEAARPTDNPDALDYILRGRAARLKPNSPDVYAEAISLFERALALDPQSVEAQTQLADSLVGRVLDEMTDSAAADLARADGLVGQVLAAK